MTGRLRKTFARNRPGMQANAAHGVLFFDNGDPFAEFRPLYRAALARRSAADTNEIVIELHRIHV